MELKIRYENGYQTINLNTEDTKKMWVSLSLEGEGLSQEEKESRIQEAFEEQFNRPEYNNWHKETRHIDPTPKRKRMDGRRGYICGEKDDDSFDIMDYLAVTYPKCGVYDEEDETAKMYESVLELIQEKVKPDFVDTFIAITSKRTTPKQIASKMVNAESLTDADQGYTQSKTHQIDEHRSVMHTYWTQKGRIFLYDILKNEGILPLIEIED